MRPVLFYYGGHALYAYWLFFGLALLLGVLLSLHLASQRNLPFWRVWGTCLLAVIAGFFFARVGHVLFGSSLSDLADFRRGGEVSFTGIVSALIIACFSGRLLRLPVRDVMDAAAPSVFLAQGIQRIGCFFNGCCHGLVSDSVLAYTCPKLLSPEGDAIGTPAFLLHLEHGLVERGDPCSLPVFPIQLVSLALCCTIASAAVLLYRRRLLHGKLVWFCLLTYGLSRFAVQWFRPNYDGEGIMSGWNSGHAYSAAVVIAALLALLWPIVAKHGSSRHDRTTRKVD